MESSQDLSQALSASREALVASFTTSHFYVEMGLIAAAILLAWGVSLFFKKRIERFLGKRQKLSVDKKIILKPLPLLAPLLAFFILSLAKPFAETYAESSEWVNAAMQIVLAFTLARAVMLIVQSRALAYFMAGVIMVLAVLNITGFMVSTRTALDSIAFELGKFRLSTLGFVQGIIILVVVFWIARLLSHTLESYLRRSSALNYNTRELVVKFFTITVYLIAFLITLGAMGIDLTALAIFGGALGVGIGLGLQKITSNFVSGITLLMEKSIKIGDLIDVDGMTGWVRQLNVRYTLIEGFDGRELLIPNEHLVSTQVTNWTYSNEHVRIDINVGIAYDSDPELAQKLMLDAAKAHPQTIEKPEASCLLREFGESALVFSLTFWINDVRDGRYGPQSEIMIDILKRFKAHGIDIPFPQRVLHMPPKD